MRRLAPLLLAATVLAGCGGDEDASTTTTSAPVDTTTTVPATADMVIAAVAVQVPEVVLPGVPPVEACTYVDTAGTGDQVTVADADGTTIGVATWELNPQADSCSWLARLSIPTGSDFYSFSSGGSTLGTLSAADLERSKWMVGIDITPYRVTLSAPVI